MFRSWFRTANGVVDRFVDGELRERHARSGLSVNEYGYDRWGTSRDDQLRALALARFFHRTYFRVENDGLEHLPEGRLILVGNVGSRLAYDGVLVSTSLFFDAEPPRLTRALVDQDVIRTPFAGNLLTRLGHVTASATNAERVLIDEQAALLVFPRRRRGAWVDPEPDRDFSSNFVRLARRTQSPVVPFALIGGHGGWALAARAGELLRSGLIVPPPTPVRILFGAPVRFEGTGDEEDEDTLPEVRQVEHAVAELIARGAGRR